MEEKDYISSKEELYGLTKTYKEKDDDEAKGMFQKLGKKWTSWYVNPFGDNQNKFNNTVLKSFEDASETLEDMDKKIQNLETKLMAVVQQNEALKTRLNKVQQTEVAIIDTCINSIERTGKDINDYVRTVNPDKRKRISTNGYKQVNDAIYNQLVNTMPKPTSEGEVNYEEVKKVYKTTLKQELRNISTVKAKRTVAIVCKGFISGQGLDTACNEAFELYRYLKKSSIYNVQFISLESIVEQPVLDTDIIMLPEKNAGQYLKAIDPTLCIFCEDTITMPIMDDYSMVLNKSIIRLSGQNPLLNLNEETIKELAYLNDLGLHKYLVQSQTAYDVLVSNGFHEPEIAYPVINTHKVTSRSRAFNKDNFTIGFASAPNTPDRLESSGVNLLCEVAKAMSNVKFEISWKYEDVEIPEELANLDNCTITKGRGIMKDFYSKIDCLIVPYTTKDGNRACSVSALEAMANGIPVLCTEISGVAEVVKYCSMGVVASPTCESVVKSINKLIDEYYLYTNTINKQRFDAKVDTSNIVDTVESFAEVRFNAKPITLKEWSKRLENNKKTLTTGLDNVVNYYDSTKSLDKYLQDAKAQQYVEFIESQNVSLILEDRFEDSKLKTLDFTPVSNNLIYKECSAHGVCTSAKLNATDINEQYNAITCFGILNKLDYPTRKSLYTKLRERLTDSGILIFDVPNVALKLNLNETLGWQNCSIYNVSWTKENIIKELEANGFTVQYILPVGQGLISKLPDSLKNTPISWTVGVLPASLT